MAPTFIIVELNSSLDVMCVAPSTQGFFDLQHNNSIDDILDSTELQRFQEICSSVMRSNIPVSCEMILRLKDTSAPSVQIFFQPVNSGEVVSDVSLILTITLRCNPCSQGLPTMSFLSLCSPREIGDNSSAFQLSASDASDSSVRLPFVPFNQRVNEVATQTENTFWCKYCAKPPEPFVGRRTVIGGPPAKVKRSKSRKPPTIGRGTPPVDQITLIEANARVLAQMFSAKEGSAWASRIDGRWLSSTPISFADNYLREITINGEAVVTATGESKQLQLEQGLLFLDGGVMTIDGQHLCRYTDDGDVICFSKVID